MLQFDAKFSFKLLETNLIFNALKYCNYLAQIDSIVTASFRIVINMLLASNNSLYSMLLLVLSQVFLELLALILLETLELSTLFLQGTEKAALSLHS